MHIFRDNFTSPSPSSSPSPSPSPSLSLCCHLEIRILVQGLKEPTEKKGQAELPEKVARAQQKCVPDRTAAARLSVFHTRAHPQERKRERERERARARDKTEGGRDAVDRFLNRSQVDPNDRFDGDSQHAFVIFPKNSS